MTDRDGNLVQHYGYYPFGSERYENNQQAFSVSNRYTGQILDEDTGLYYYGARYYDPELGRFIQADPIVPGPDNSQAFNRYSYCFNNPLKFVDPTGHWPDVHGNQAILQSNFPSGWAPPSYQVIGTLSFAGGIGNVFTVSPGFVGANGLSGQISGSAPGVGYGNNITFLDIIAPGLANTPLVDFPVDPSVLKFSPSFSEGYQIVSYAVDMDLDDWSPKVHYICFQGTASLIGSVTGQTGWAWDDNTGEFGLFWTYGLGVGTPAASVGFSKGTLFNSWIFDEIGGGGVSTGVSWLFPGYDVGVTDSKILLRAGSINTPSWIPEAHMHRTYTFDLPVGNYKEIKKDIIKISEFTTRATRQALDSNKIPGWQYQQPWTVRPLEP